MGREQSWLTLCVIRQSKWARAVSQLTQVSHLLVRWFFELAGVDVRNVGVNLQLTNGRSIRVFLKLGVVAGDEPGIKEMLSNKGHAGALPCVMCMNCVLHTHPGAVTGAGLHAHDARISSIAETDVSKFRPVA